jgi:hypothetical protein
VTVWGAICLSTMVAAGVCSLVATRVRQRTSGRTRRDSASARRFAELVAQGDFEAAESIARDVFAGRRLVRVVEWDERAVLALSMEQVRRELTDPELAATWFPDARRSTPGDDLELAVGPDERLHLAVASEEWTEDRDGLTWQAVTASFALRGSLSLRTLLTHPAGSQEMTTAVEVAVHMEAPDEPEARRALAAARAITHQGLGRLSALLSPR